jgi:hypothetical protein
MRRQCAMALSLLAAGVTPPRAAAQWSLGLDLGASHFTGASFDTSTGGSGISFRPQHPVVVSLRLDHARARVRFGLGVLYAGAGLVAENGDAAAVQKGFFSLLELAPEGSIRLARSGAGTELRVHAGPLVDFWSVSEGTNRTRAGAHAALSAGWPIGGRMTGLVRVAAAFTGSVFDAGELPSELARRAMWRRTVSVGLRCRL